MERLGKKGIAPIIVLTILLMSTGAAIATPVVVDAVGVDPDSPLYGLGRLGERIRMASDEEQMKKRWGEYSRMVNRGKGLEYQSILEEFQEKMESVAPSDAEAKKEIVRWMQEQMLGIGLVELKLAKQFSQDLKKQMANIPGAIRELENETEVLERLENQFPNASPELQENILARLRLITQELQLIARQLGNQPPRGLRNYFHIDNMMIDLDIRMNIHAKNDNWRPTPENAVEFFNAKLGEFNEKLTEIQVKLEGAPENAPGRQAAERQVELAVKLRDNAVEANNSDNVKKAILLLRTAYIHLNNADKILEHADEWEKKFSEQWKDWKKGWENIKPRLLENEKWKEIQKNFQEYIKDIREQWKEQWKNQKRGEKPED